jgi:nitrite reductase/ring-hydroxylating ferredoxin subunit
MQLKCLLAVVGFAVGSIVFSAGSALADFNVNDRVECRWKNGSTWYPGVIVEKTGKQVFIHYNDGDKEHTTINKCRKISSASSSGSLKKGSLVSCYWKGGNTLYPGVIVEKTGQQVFIHYNDGDKEHTTLDKCLPR